MIDWIKRFFSGFALWQPPVIGKWLYYGVLFVIFMGVYSRIFPPRPQQTNNVSADRVTIEAPNKKDAAFFGVRIWRLSIGARVE